MMPKKLADKGSTNPGANKSATLANRLNHRRVYNPRGQADFTFPHPRGFDFQLCQKLLRLHTLAPSSHTRAHVGNQILGPDRTFPFSLSKISDDFQTPSSWVASRDITLLT